MKGSCIQVAYGHVMDPVNPSVDDIYIEDIAHALSNQCRFAGHTMSFYSVAEHCVRVSQEVYIRNPEEALWGLLHDASEAYLVDLPSPIKYNTGIGYEYKLVEDNLMWFIKEKFDLKGDMPEAVRQADLRLLATEVRDLMQYAGTKDQKELWEPWIGGVTKLEDAIEPLSPELARAAYMIQFHKLIGV